MLPDVIDNTTMTGPHVCPHSADLIGPPLIYRRGGVWIEVGILFFRSPDDICRDELEIFGEPVQDGWVSISVSSDRMDNTPHQFSYCEEGESICETLA